MTNQSRRLHDLNDEIIMPVTIDCLETTTPNDFLVSISAVDPSDLNRNTPYITPLLNKKAVVIDSDDSDVEPRTEVGVLPPSQYSFGNVREIDGSYIINDEISISKLNWHTITGDQFNGFICLVCDCHIINILVHINSGRHLFNMDHRNPLQAFGLSLVRLINKVYHCAICNVTFPTEHNEHVTHLTSQRHLTIYNEANKRARNFLNESPKLPSNQLTYDKMRKKPQWEDPPDFIFGIKENFYKIEFKNWHMVVCYTQAYYCMCCRRDGDVSYKYDHMFSTEHNMALRGFPLLAKYWDNLVRRMNTEYNHCMHCNIMFHITKDKHINTESHKNRMLLNMLNARMVPPNKNSQQNSIQTDINEVLTEPLSLQSDNGLHQNTQQNSSVNVPVPPPVINKNIQQTSCITLNIAIPGTISPPMPNKSEQQNLNFMISCAPPVKQHIQNVQENENLIIPNQCIDVTNRLNKQLFSELRSNDLNFRDKPFDLLTHLDEILPITSSTITPIYNRRIRITENDNNSQMTPDIFQQTTNDITNIVTNFTANELKNKFSMIDLDLYSKFNKNSIKTFDNIDESELTYFEGDIYMIDNDDNKIEHNDKVLVWPELIELEPYQVETDTAVPLLKLTPEGLEAPAIVYCSYCDVYEENFTDTSILKTRRNNDELFFNHASVFAIRIINKTWAHCRICDILVKLTEMKNHFAPNDPFYDCNFEIDEEQPREMVDGHEVVVLNNNINYCLCCDDYFEQYSMVQVKINDSMVVTSNLSWNSIVDTNMVRYCLVCEEQLEYTNIQKHVATDRHNENLHSVKVLEQYSANMIRKVKDIYHCGVCSILIMVSSVFDHLNWEPHIKAFSEKVAQSVKNPESLPIVEAQLDYQTDCSDRDHIKDKIIPFRLLQSEDFPRDPLRKNFYKAIIVGHTILKVKWQHWNGVLRLGGGFKCIICQCYFEDVDMHINTFDHLYNLENVDIIPELKIHLLSKVRDSNQIHCITCNCELKMSDNLYEHVSDRGHEKYFKNLRKDTEQSVLLDERVYRF